MSIYIYKVEQIKCDSAGKKEKYGWLNLNLFYLINVLYFKNIYTSCTRISFYDEKSKQENVICFFFFYNKNEGKIK